MLKKCFIKCLYLFLVLVFLYANICYATVVAVTDENLKESLQKFVLSEANKENYNITVSKNVITVMIDSESYTLNYDLTNKPKFTLEIPIEKGMSYDDFEKKTDNLMLPMIGYIAVANIQNVDIEDASAYFLLSYLANALNGEFTFNSSNSYMIIDDTAEGITIETDNPNAIKVSEFGERVMEYVKAIYPETQSISDAEEINSYTLTTERKDDTSTSCKLVSTLTVNLDADFSKIIEYMQQNDNSSTNDDTTKENADLVVTLKVGQKCKLESTEKITGYSFLGSDCVEINDDKTELTGTKIGKINGYLYIGEEQKTIYIEVEENTNNEALETITLKIETASGNAGTNTEGSKEDIKQESNKTTPTDNTVVSSKIPRAGSKNSILFIIMAFVVIIILIRIRLRKYKDIR